MIIKWGLALLTAFLAVAGAWWLRPFPTVRHSVRSGNGIHVEERNRTHALLPLGQWGFGSDTGSSYAFREAGIYPTSTYVSRFEIRLQFGFFKVTDTTVRWFEPLPEDVSVEKE